MIVKEIKGSILDAPQKFIAHGVNCQNVMGSGVAKVLFERYPDVKSRYHSYCESVAVESRLGSVCSTRFQDDGKIILNLFTQFRYGYNNKRYVNYAAIAQCFKNLITYGTIKEVAIPKIGCGLAGGDWEIVRQIINDATLDDLDVYVYYL